MMHAEPPKDGDEWCCDECKEAGFQNMSKTLKFNGASGIALSHGGRLLADGESITVSVADADGLLSKYPSAFSEANQPAKKKTSKLASESLVEG